MKAFVIIILILLNIPARAGDTLHWKHLEHDSYTLHFTDPDQQNIIQLQADIENGKKVVEGFFAGTYNHPFAVWIFPDRKALDGQWQKDWQLPNFKSECWMVASGVAKRLDVLSPSAWSKEACDHNPNDQKEVAQIITHELVHIFHAQHNPKPDFDGMDDASWMVEGLAAYASGQLTSQKLKEVIDAVKKGTVTDSLVSIWKGPLRYQQAGSLILFIDKKYGREMLKTLLSYTTVANMLAAMNISEIDLVKQWKAFLLSRRE